MLELLGFFVLGIAGIGISGLGTGILLAAQALGSKKADTVGGALILAVGIAALYVAYRLCPFDIVLKGA